MVDPDIEYTEDHHDPADWGEDTPAAEDEEESTEEEIDLNHNEPIW